MQKCFNRSLERIQQNYEESGFLNNMGSPIARNTLWQSPRSIMANSEYKHGDKDSSLLESAKLRRRGMADFQSCVPPIMTQFSNGNNAVDEKVSATLKPKTSVGIAREHLFTPIRVLESGQDSNTLGNIDEGVNTKIGSILRESIHTSQKATRRVASQFQ